jgi:metal-dependent amidase/aminoacylase/carboxypeptidase family protein
MDETWRRETHVRIEEIIRGVCLANRTEYELDIKLGYPALSNDPWATSLAQSAAKELLGDGSVFPAPPMMGAEDFAYYLEKIPGTFWWLGAGTADQGCISGLHSPTFTINEQILPIGSALMAWVAYKFLTTQ